jgi:hypothetical protein
MEQSGILKTINMLNFYNMFDEEVDKMSAEELKTRSRYGCCGILIGVILIVLCSLFMAGCTTTKVVTVEKVHTDTLREYRNVHDSIHVHDSVSVKDMGHGVGRKVAHQDSCNGIARHDL